MKNKIPILLLIIFLINIKVYTQDKKADELEKVQLDFGTGRVVNAVPFDKHFIIEGTLPSRGNNVYVKYNGKGNDGQLHDFTFQGTVNGEDKTFKVLFDYPLPFKRYEYKFNLCYDETISPEEIGRMKILLNKIIFDFIKNEEETLDDGSFDTAITTRLQTLLKGKIDMLLVRDSRTIKIMPNSFLDINSSNSENIFQLSKNFSDFRNRRTSIGKIEADKFDSIISNYLINKVKNYGGKDSAINLLKNSNPDDCLTLMKNGCGDIGVLTEISQDMCKDLPFDGTLSSLELRSRIKIISKNLSIINKSDLPLGNNDFLRGYLDELNNTTESISIIENSLKQILDEIEITAPVSISFTGTKSSSMETRAGWYSSADVGILYAYEQREFLPFIGMNLYFRPIDKNIPFERLRSARKFRGESGNLFSYRFSAVVGLTFGGLTNKSDDPKFNIIFGRGIVSGIGYRLTESLKLNAGALWFNQKNINPLITQYSLKATPYISLSLDWDLKNFVNNFFFK